MKRVFLLILLSLVTLILIVATAAGVLLAVINPNDYKEDIAKAVLDATGRRLVIEGDIGVQFFPGIGLQTGRLIMQDPPVFGADPLIAVDSASLNIALGPLLRQRVEVRDIQLNGVQLKLVRTATGQKNWELVGSEKETEKKTEEGVIALADEAPRSEQERASAGMPLSLAVDKVQCRNVGLIYRNLAVGESYRLNLDTLDLNNVNLDADISLAASGTAHNLNAGQKAQFSLKALVKVSEALNAEGQLTSLDLTLSGGGKSMTGAGSTTFFFNKKNHALVLEHLALSAGNAALSGKLTLAFPTQTSQGLGAKGVLTVDALDLNPFLADIRPILQSAPAGSVGSAPNMQNITPGTGARRPALQRVDQGGDAKDSSLPPALTALDAAVTLTFKQLIVDKMSIKDMTIHILSDKGHVEIPYTLNLFQGMVQGTASVNLREAPPRVAVQGQVDGLRLEEALLAFTGEKSASGAAAGNIDVAAQGMDWRAMAPTLKGKVSVQGTNLEVKHFTLPQKEFQQTLRIPEAFPAERASASFTITSGVAVSRDILLDSRIIAGKGGGSVNLVKEQLDLSMDLRVGGAPPAIPLVLKGDFDRPFLRVDEEKLLKNAAKEALSSPKVQEKIRKNLSQDTIKMLDSLFKKN